jgi:hypothetical protein
MLNIKYITYGENMNIEKELDSYISKYYLEESGTDECPGCSRELQYYTSKYDDEVMITHCSGCGIEKYNLNFEKNICELCGELVRFEDEDKDNYIICSHDECDEKIHKECLEDNNSDIYKSWNCSEHEK